MVVCRWRSALRWSTTRGCRLGARTRNPLPFCPWVTLRCPELSYVPPEHCAPGTMCPRSGLPGDVGRTKQQTRPGLCLKGVCWGGVSGTQKFLYQKWPDTFIQRYVSFIPTMVSLVWGAGKGGGGAPPLPKKNMQHRPGQGCETHALNTLETWAAHMILTFVALGYSPIQYLGL